MVTGASKGYILNALELYKKKIDANERALNNEIHDAFPTNEDNTVIPEILEKVKAALPEEFGVKWVGKRYDCCKERFYMQINVWIDVAKVEVTNEKMREAALAKLRNLREQKRNSLDEWNANAWVALTNKNEVPIFDPSLTFDYTDPAILKEVKKKD